MIKVGIGSKKYTVEQVWDWIDSPEYDYEFYTEDHHGNQAVVQAGISVKGRKFLTTDPDKSIDNNLDELATCV